MALIDEVAARVAALLDGLREDWEQENPGGGSGTTLTPDPLNEGLFIVGGTGETGAPPDPANAGLFLAPAAGADTAYAGLYASQRSGVTADPAHPGLYTP